MIADANGFERGHSFDGRILLDEDVLEAGLLRGGEDGLVVDVAAADLGGAVVGVDAEGGAVGRVGGEVFGVHEGIAAGILFEVIDGILARSGKPAAVELKFDEPGVGLFEEDLVTGVAAAIVAELKVVVVIGVLEAGFFELALLSHWLWRRSF